MVTAPQMTALSAFCFIAVVFLAAPLISCKGNKNHYLVNISHSVGHPDPKKGEMESRAVRQGGRQRRKECGRENPLVKGWFLHFHIVDSLWLGENMVH